VSDGSIVAAPKHWVSQFVERARGAVREAPANHPLSYAKESASVLAEFAEGGAVGALLGAAHAKFGLDVGGVPVEGILAGVGALAGIGLSGHMPTLAAALRKGGAQAFTVLSFRKSYEMMKGPAAASTAQFGAERVERIAAPGTGPGVTSPDSILETAKKVDI
jgi:hypothetical protein